MPIDSLEDSKPNFSKEPQEKDVSSMSNNRPPIKGDKQPSVQDVKSNASSDLSERTRNEILGLPYARKIVADSRPNLTNSGQPARKESNSSDKDHPLLGAKDSSFVAINSNQTVRKESNSSNNVSSLTEVKEPPFVKKIVTAPDPPLPKLGMVQYPPLPRKPANFGGSSSNYKTAETQTAEVGDMTSKRCGTCRCNHCKLMNAKYETSPEETTPSELSNSSDDSSCQLETYSETSTQTTTDDCHFISCPYCGRYRPWNNFGGCCTSEEQTSEVSDTCNSSLYDLPYQNNDEYLQLVRELEHKLLARNRERVRRTMREFELRSRQNMNLEKPVYDYDCGDEINSVISRVKPNKQKKCNCCNGIGRRKQANSDILQNEKRWNCGQIDIAESVVTTIDPHQQQNCSKYERTLHRSHWQLDPRSGEWVKASFNKTEYGRGGPGCDDGCQMFRMASPCSKNGRRQRKKF